MKYYLSGPMAGYEHHNFPEFERVASILRKQEMEVFSPHELNDGDDGMPGSLRHSWYMRRDLKLLLECDAIIMLGGWEDSVGAKAEKAVADVCEMKVFYLRTALEEVFQDEKGGSLFTKLGVE